MDQPRSIHETDRPRRVNTGKSGFLRSVVANWAGEAVVILGGLLLPRVINHQMSRDELGVWDYGWSVRSYVAYADPGMGSGGGYYVARYRQRPEELNRILGAMLALLLYGAAGGVLFTLGFTYLTPYLVNTESAALLSDAASLVVSMGLAACLTMPTYAFTGIIVGNHRFDVLNLINAVTDIFLLAAVLSTVLFGLGLKVMGLCVLTRELLNGIGKYWAARRIAPDLIVRPRWTDWPIFREISGFSSKTIVDDLSKFLQFQIAVLVISTVMGPAGIALYSRPRALIGITTRFVMGFARVLVPAASALHDQPSAKTLSELLIRSTRYGLFLALPPALGMIILGGPLLRVWMGDASYADNNVLLILAIGYLPLFVQQPTYHILVGLASHGMAGIASLIGSIVGGVMCILFVAVLGWGLDGAALAAAIPVLLVNLCVLPYAGCRAAQLPLRRYLRETLPTPLLSVVPFAIVLVVARVSFPDDAKAQLLVGALAGALSLAPVYWFTAVPAHVKHRLRRWWHPSL